MNRRLCSALVIGAALFAHGCGSDEKTPEKPSPQSDWAASHPTPTSGFKFTTGKFEIQAGDNFECIYTDTITEKQLNVSWADGAQGPGGHHILVYYADSKQPPGHHKCIDEEMIGLHQVIGVAGEKGNEGIIGMPDGYAVKLPAGKQLVLQSHYIWTGEPTTVEDWVELRTLEEKDVKAFANAFVINDASFKLPPRSNPTSTSECVVPQDFDVFVLLGHMHEWGASYKLESLDAAGKAETIYQNEWDPLFTSHPPINYYDPATPLKLKKGQRLRQTCAWRNNEDYEMRFPREMCVMFAYYAPDNGFQICDAKGKMQ